MSGEFTQHNLCVQTNPFAPMKYIILNERWEFKVIIMRLNSCLFFVVVVVVVGITPQNEISEVPQQKKTTQTHPDRSICISYVRVCYCYYYFITCLSLIHFFVAPSLSLALAIWYFFHNFLMCLMVLS